MASTQGMIYKLLKPSGNIPRLESLICSVGAVVIFEWLLRDSCIPPLSFCLVFLVSSLSFRAVLASANPGSFALGNEAFKIYL